MPLKHQLQAKLKYLVCIALRKLVSIWSELLKDEYSNLELLVNLGVWANVALHRRSYGGRQL